MLPGQFFDQNKASEVVFMKLICMFVESKNHKSEIQNPLRILPLRVVQRGVQTQNFEVQFSAM